ncbi:polysaccharide deacetylase [Pseudonocardia sediminis]|uniref:Polysaccharide deacetylase n=1 Tax=Pseudonocardia sediminis TaxID=1397368 RepID=A0A4Q7UXM1_PSEST|nr:polysaccharide deacetylase family protein [Pseudonocardia sediminis]RZT85691.1 polysaccharide deacetylase [Pseudonocardia sediminis]
MTGPWHGTAPAWSGWPGDRKLAVMITVMVELWSPGGWPPYAPMAAAWPLPGAPDHHSISWSRYGIDDGAWRLARILNSRCIPATFGVSGLVGEERPDLVRALHRDGHEIAAHSWTQDVVPALLDAEAEEANLTRCLDGIGSLTGHRPVGWMSPRAGFSDRTADLLARHAMTWWGDHNDRDLPSVLATDHGPLVRIMHSDVTDVRSTGGPAAYHRDHRDLLAVLLAEPGPGVLNVTVHAHVGGRPLPAAMFDRVLTEIQKAGDSVWIATHQQVAEHVLADPAADGNGGSARS